MKKFSSRVLNLGLVILPVLMGTCRANADDIFRTNFEDNRPTWISYGKQSHAGITREPIHVKEGRAALQFDYLVEPGSFYGLGKIFKPGQLKDFKSLRFWVKTDGTTPFGVLLQEQNGGRYVAAFTVPGDSWQQVELAPSDFALWQNIGTTADANNQLDVDRLEWVALGDFNQVPVQFEDSSINQLFRVRMGPHVLFMDDIKLSSEPVTEVKAAPGETPLDLTQRPQLMWLTMGSVKLSRTPAESGAALQLEYQQIANEPQGMYHLLPPGILRERKKLAFTANSQRAMTLYVLLEEPSGGKYSAHVKIPAGQATDVRMPFADFKPTVDSRDNNNRLDIDQLYQLSLFEEIATAPVPSMAANTLQLSNFRAVVD